VAKKIFNVLFISVFAAVLGLGIIAPLMPIYARNLGATGIWLGIIFAAFSVSRGIVTPFMGRLSDEKGRKILITSGLFLYSIISLLYIMATNVYSLTAVRIFHGIASSMVIPVAMAYIGETVKKGDEGRAMGTFNIALFSGMATGPLIGGILDARFGMASVFYAMAALSACAFLAALVFLPDLRQKKPPEKYRTPFHMLKKDSTVKSLFVFRFIEATGKSGVMVFLPLFGAARGISIFELGMLISACLFITAIFQRPFGMLADKLDNPLMIIAGLLVVAAMFMIIPFCLKFKMLLLASSVMGLGSAISIPAATVMAVKIGKKSGMGASMGLFSSGMSLGMTISPLYLGIIMDRLGIDYVFWVAGAITLSGIAVFYLLTRKEPVKYLKEAA